MKNVTVTFDKLKYLASPLAVRERADQMYQRALAGKTQFDLDEEALKATADFVIELTRKNYPDISKIPFHDRWEHFRAGGIDRVKILEERLKDQDPLARARCYLDLVFVSVLLDAGAGAQWKYQDGTHGTYDRSEGLAVASFNMFCSGLFSSHKNKPYQVDSKGLCQLKFEDLSRAFQAGHHNPLLGVEGRWELLKRLGHIIEKRADYFHTDEGLRIGGLVDYWKKNNDSIGCISASQILTTLIFCLEGMWTPRLIVNDVGFGDMWLYDFGHISEFENIVPFHKLSQWLSYSCFFPIETSGLRVVNAHELTGLPEYRNGGLFMDMRVLNPKDSQFSKKVFQVSDPFVLEWRALTVACLDRLAKIVREKLQLSEEAFPLGKLLQGGTWAAGRKLASQYRNGLPPVQVVSDGTVF